MLISIRKASHLSPVLVYNLTRVPYNLIPLEPFSKEQTSREVYTNGKSISSENSH